MSDEIIVFIKNTKSLDALISRWNYFYKLYRDFFAYHQAVYWSSEYLAKIRDSLEDKKKVEKIIDILDKAYKYNEAVVPSVESYFLKLGISHLNFNEVNGNVLKNLKSKPKRRSICLINNKVLILPLSEASRINKAIRGDYNNFLKKNGGVKGLGVSKGVTTGIVRLVKDLNQLKKCKRNDILVTTQTRPQFNSFIKLVKAIVTDEGGHLCHASMLAREFDIPCVVGTKNATKVLKNGDKIEVDASVGVIKVLKKIN